MELAVDLWMHCFASLLASMPMLPKQQRAHRIRFSFDLAIKNASAAGGSQAQTGQQSHYQSSGTLGLPAPRGCNNTDGWIDLMGRIVPLPVSAISIAHASFRVSRRSMQSRLQPAMQCNAKAAYAVSSLVFSMWRLTLGIKIPSRLPRSWACLSPPIWLGLGLAILPSSLKRCDFLVLS